MQDFQGNSRGAGIVSPAHRHTAISRLRRDWASAKEKRRWRAARRGSFESLLSAHKGAICTDRLSASRFLFVQPATQLLVRSTPALNKKNHDNPGGRAMMREELRRGLEGRQLSVQSGRKQQNHTTAVQAQEASKSRTPSSLPTDQRPSVTRPMDDTAMRAVC